MTDRASEQYEKLREMHPEAKLLEEGGNPVVLLPDATFPVAGKSRTMHLLLHPSKHSGYPTRLFFAERIDHQGTQNWKQFSVVGRTWWACSWGGVEAKLDWPAILCAHLRAVA